MSFSNFRASVCHLSVLFYYYHLTAFWNKIRHYQATAFPASPQSTHLLCCWCPRGTVKEEPVSPPAIALRRSPVAGPVQPTSRHRGGVRAVGGSCSETGRGTVAEWSRETVVLRGGECSPTVLAGVWGDW